MASAVASASQSIWRRGDSEVSLGRLYVLRAAFLLFAVTFPFGTLPRLIHHAPTERGMILGILAGLWVMSLIGLRYPLQMLPIVLFEFVWKSIWLLAFGLPQWWSGVGSPRLSQDLLEIGSVPFFVVLVIPWGYVWRHYVKQPGDGWRPS